MATLEEHLDQSYELEEVEGAPRFIVDDEAKANWAMRKVAKVRRKQQENTALANAERARIDEWVTSENDKLEQQAAFFEGLLIEFHHAELARDEKRKTITLPTGKLESRKQQPIVEVETDPFLEWATKERPEFVRTKHEVDKIAVKEAAVKDGEKLPHVTVTIPVDRSFTVKPQID